MRFYKKSSHLLCTAVQMKHDFIEANRHLYGVKLLCQALHVSRSGFYAARHRLPSARWQRQTMLTTQNSAIHSASRDTYGAPRIHAELAAQGVACSHNTVAKLMRQAAIMPRCIRRFRVTTDSRKTKAPKLHRTWCRATSMPEDPTNAG